MMRSNGVYIRKSWRRGGAGAAGIVSAFLVLTVAATAPAQTSVTDTGADPAALERLQRDYMALARVASATAAELSRVKEDLRLADAARTTAERDRERLGADLSRLREELRGTLDIADEAQRNLNTALDEKIQMQGDLAGHARTLRDLQRRYDHLERQSGDAEASKKALEELRRERDRWMRERADLERRLARAEGGGGTVDPRRPPASSSPSSESAEDRAEIARLRRALEEDRAAFAAERNSLESQLIEVLQTQERERDAQLREKVTLQRAVEVLRARLDQAVTVLPEAVAPPATPPIEPVAESAELETLRRELEAANKDRETMDREITKLTDHTVALERRVAEIEEYAARAAQAEVLAEEASSVRRDLAKARERMAALDALVTELRSRTAMPTP